jgi:outer membrane receptor protein involved in Fe transport
MKSMTRLLVVVFVSMLLSVAAFGQTINGIISGIVVDESGAVVPGASVVARNPNTGFTRTVTTDGDGSFRIVGLPVATYNVRVEKQGFKTTVSENILATVGSDTGLRLTLQTGEITAVVQVTSSGEVLDTTQGQVVKNVSQVQIANLPGQNTLNGLALLNPGVLPNAQGRPGSGFAVNGNRTRSNNFTIDGANNNDQSLSIPRQSLPFGALEEFTIVTNTPKAEFGRNAGSYVNQITKSGTNRFSGEGFWTWGGNGVDALTTAQQRSFNANVANLGEHRALRNARSVTVDNSYGFVFGGPIKEDHTFFFTSMDWNDFRQTVSSAARVAFSPLALQRLQYPGRAGVVPQAVQFILNNYPVANDPTSQGSLTLTGTTALAVCPANDPVSCNVLPLEVFNRARLAGIPFGTDFGRYMFKVNSRFSEKDNFSVRYLYDKSVNPGAPATLVGQEIGQTLRNDSLTFNDSYIINSRWLNEARFTFSRRDILFPENLPFSFAIGGSGVLTRGNANFPQFRNDKVYEFTDNVSYNRSNHAVKFGYNMLIYKLASFFAPNTRGTVTYPSIVNFLTDTNASYQRFAGDGLTDATTYEHSMFVQDDWRVNPDLNVNIGLRYEYITTPYGFFSNASPDINNFGPRFGIAWNPKNWFDGRMVLRGGFGISYDQVFQNVLLNNSRNFPRGVNIAQTNISGQLPFVNLPPAPTPAQFTGNPLLLPVRLFSPNERVKQPMSTQWTVSMQYQLNNDWVFKSEYIGNIGRNLIREIETNYGFTVAAGGTGLRLDPTRGSILVGQGIADSSYHSGQFTLERRFSRLSLGGFNFGDLVFNGNYTWSVFMSESDDVLGGQANRTLPADPRNPKLDRARSGFDQPHRFVTNFVYRVRDFVDRGDSLGTKFVSSLVNGWTLSAVGTYASGTPFSVLSANNALGILPGQISTVEGSQRVSVNPAGQYPLVSTPTNPVANAYFIVNDANSGILGNLGANTERTGDTRNWNMALSKNFRTFGERQSFSVRADVFNVFNRRNFTQIPSNTIGNTVNTTTFLNLGFTNVGGRGFTFGARYSF